MRYVILGGSIAGLSAAQTVRSRDESGEIAIVTDEPGRPYYRPLISHLIDGTRSRDDLALVDDPMSRLGANTVRCSAARIDVNARTVFMNNSDKLTYDRLLIATGASPIVPKIKDCPDGSLFVLRTADDAVRLKNAAGTAKNIVVIGGGMVGIKAATALRRLPERPAITIIEKEAHVLPLRLDARAAEIVANALEKEGIRVRTGVTVVEMTMRDGKPAAVRLSDRTAVDADLVVAAVGVQPNIGFLKGSGITVRSGVVVDERLRTSAQDVFAAGDVAECKDIVTGRSFASALWTNAVDMGRLAGENMTGGKASAAGFLPVMNAAEVAGIPFISAGIVEPDGGYAVTVNERDGAYYKVVEKSGYLAGVLFVHDVRNAGVYVNMLRNRVPIDRSKRLVASGMATYADVAAAV